MDTVNITGVLEREFSISGIRISPIEISGEMQEIVNLDSVIEDIFIGGIRNTVIDIQGIIRRES